MVASARLEGCRIGQGDRPHRVRRHPVAGALRRDERAPRFGGARPRRRGFNPEARRATPAFIRFRSLSLAFPRKRVGGRRRGASAADRGPVFGRRRHENLVGVSGARCFSRPPGGAVGCDRPRRYSGPRTHAASDGPCRNSRSAPRKQGGWIVQFPCAPLFRARAPPRLARPPRPVLCASPAPFSSKRETEGWPSGRRRTPGKCVYGKPYRGFESRPLRQELSV